MRSGVALRESRDKVLVFLGDDADFDRLLQRLRQKLADGAPKRRAEVMIDIGKRILTERELTEIQRVVGERPNLRLVSIVDSIDMASKPAWWPESADEWDEDEPMAEATATGDVTSVCEAEPVPQGREYVVSEANYRPAEEPPQASQSIWQRRQLDLKPLASSDTQVTLSHNACLLKTTVRSGQSVAFDGDVVIIGDVNPGGEILATGDIVVMGTLRGVAHAGASGNRQAMVAAMRLVPTQLRIGDIVARPPDGSREHPEGAEVARIRDDVLTIEKLDRYLPSGRKGGERGE